MIDYSERQSKRDIVMVLIYRSIDKVRKEE